MNKSKLDNMMVEAARRITGDRGEGAPQLLVPFQIAFYAGAACMGTIIGSNLGELVQVHGVATRESQPDIAT